MSTIMLWGHGSFRPGFGSFQIPPYVEIQFFCADNDEIDDAAIRQFEYGDLSNGIAPGLIAKAAAIQASIHLESVAAGAILKNYKLESILGDITAAGSKHALKNRNVWTPGKHNADDQALTYLKDWLRINSYMASATNPLVVQWCACRSNYAGTEGEQVSVALPTPALPSKSRCYITTASCLALGLGDDCETLNQLRWFRDQILMSSAAGRAEVETYYETAPRIVAAIESGKDPRCVYESIFQKTLLPAIVAIESGNFEEARRIYTGMVQSLRARYAV